MFRISKEFHFCASHCLDTLPKGHKCAGLHGHNYVVMVELEGETVDESGFLVDFYELDALKKYIDDEFDHRHLNDVLDVSPSTENVAHHFFFFSIHLVRIVYRRIFGAETRTFHRRRYRPRRSRFKRIVRSFQVWLQEGFPEVWKVFSNSRTASGSTDTTSTQLFPRTFPTLRNGCVFIERSKIRQREQIVLEIFQALDASRIFGNFIDDFSSRFAIRSIATAIVSKFQDVCDCFLLAFERGET